MTTEKFKTPRAKKRRTCWDQLRARMLESRRQRRGDPATSTAAQLLAVFALLFGRMPLIPNAAVPALYTPPLTSPGHARRAEIARRLGIPSRCVDIVLTHGTVSYKVLFEHIRRGGRSREDAMSVLRQKAPGCCRDWLDHVGDWSLWSELLLCHVWDGDDEDTDVKLLKSTLAWLDIRTPDNGVSGPAGTGAALKPGNGMGEPDPDDEPQPPKP